MDPAKITSEINRLSMSQKLLLAQDIWDSIARDSDTLPMPAWQKNEIEKRYNLYKQGKIELHDWQEVHNQLRERHNRPLPGLSTRLRELDPPCSSQLPT